ncbi:serine hydrolase domain-containing protein [Saccharibacillus qingshengii]|uniref:serine hydrolase domain-containing protein n=1 Tax=Saccharibacillus qingshengii TaxID=1763540 RepID=UPI001554AAE0|nr:serine hydrolase domain-containing protein [Saccharibacillus qingshengii]
MLPSDTIESLKKTLRSSIERHEIAGANLMVLQHGQELFYQEDGLADLESGRPMTRDTIFRLYSMTKPITAAAVMILMERGEIDLFDPVSRYIPGFRNPRVEQNGQLAATVREPDLRDLLNMTSGLVYGGEDAAGRHAEALFRELGSRLHGDQPMDTLEFADRVGQGPLAFEPGSNWMYGTSADILGAVVEVASGIRFGEFLRREIFEPLGMADTGFWLPEGKRKRLAKTVQQDGKGGLKPYEDDHLGIIHRMNREPAFESGGAGLCSTIDDAAKFTTMLMNEGSLGSARLLKPRTVRQMTSAALNERQQASFKGWHSLAGHSYGSQMRIMTDPGQAGLLGSQGEYGWDGWLGAYFANSPLDKLTFLFMVQKRDAGTLPVTRKLRNLVFAGL